MNAAMGLDSMKEMGGMGPFSESDFKGIGSVTMNDLAKAGRFGDKFLAHVADGEMLLPKEFLNQNPYIKDKVMTEMKGMGLNPESFIVNGGDLTNVNPETGMPEFGFFSSVVKAVKKVVKPVANIVVPIAATIACGGNPACGAAASAAMTKAQGGSWGDALKSAAFTYAGQSFAQGMGSSLTATDAAGNVMTGWDAVTTGLNPFNAAGELAMPSALGGTTYGATPGANPIQGFFQQAGGAVKGALTPGMSIGQGWTGGVTAPQGITSLGSNATDAYYKSMQSNIAAGMDPMKAQAAAEMAARQAASVTTFAPTAANATSTVSGFGKGVVNVPPEVTQMGPNATEAYRSTIAAGGDVFDAQAAAQAAGIGGGTSSAASSGSGISGLLDTALEFADQNPKTTAALVAGATGLAGYMSAQEPVPENEMAKYDATARKEIEAYNACLAGGGTNCSVPTDLRPVKTDYNLTGTPGNMYNQYREARQAGVAPQGYGVAAAKPTATNVIDLYKQFAARPTIAPQTKYGLGALLAANGGHIAGPGTGTSDSIDARLSDGEFVMTAKAVRGAGNGSRKKGVANMYKMMRHFEGVA